MEEIYDQAAAMLARWSSRVESLKTIYPSLSADFKKIEGEIYRLEQAIRFQKLKPMVSGSVTESNWRNLVREIAGFLDRTDALEAQINWLDTAKSEATSFFAEHPGSKPLMPAMKAAAENGKIELSQNAYQNITRAHDWVKKNPSEAERLSKTTTKSKPSGGSSIEDDLASIYDRLN